MSFLLIFILKFFFSKTFLVIKKCLVSHVFLLKLNILQGHQSTFFLLSELLTLFTWTSQGAMHVSVFRCYFFYNIPFTTASIHGITQSVVRRRNRRQTKNFFEIFIALVNYFIRSVFLNICFVCRFTYNAQVIIFRVNAKKAS